MFPDRFLKKLRHCYLENSAVLVDLSDCWRAPIAGASARRFRAN